MQKNKVKNIIKQSAIIIYCFSCIYFGWIRGWDNHQPLPDDRRPTLWESARVHTTEEFYTLFSSDPFLSVFYPNPPQLTHDSLLQLFPNGAIHSACWHFDSTNVTKVNYYCDKNSRCLIVSYTDFEDTHRIMPYNEWYYIHSNGLIRFDSLKLVANLLYAIALYILPWLLLIQWVVALSRWQDTLAINETNGQ